MRRKLFVALRLKVPHHCIESLADRRIIWVEDPCTLGAGPTALSRLVYPHKLAPHGRIICSKTSVINIDHPGHQLEQVPRSPSGRVYALLTTDIGRFCRKVLMSALLICKPPL